MYEIILETMQELLFVGEDILKPTSRNPDNVVNKVKNLISETKNFIGTLDICQLSSEPINYLDPRVRRYLQFQV